jgi:hypothetical protein
VVVVRRNLSADAAMNVSRSSLPHSAAAAPELSRQLPSGGVGLLTSVNGRLDRWKVSTRLEASRERLVVWSQIVTASELDPSGSPRVLLSPIIPVGIVPQGWLA